MDGLLQVKVVLKIVFLKLGEIDTLHDCFGADVYIQAKWREPALDGKRTVYAARQ